jgi:SAM-dependent methyltransferase
MKGQRDASEIRDLVRDSYARVAVGQRCGVSSPEQATAIGREIGYSEEALAADPDANLGLGCGAPLELVPISPGAVVLDLGSGAGFDALQAARRVGDTGRVIGVDMTAAMIERARANAERSGLSNVEFRLGLIEELPVEAASVDVVISNCVINLSPEKQRVFAEIHRVLRRGGWLAVSDLVLMAPLPVALHSSVEAYVGCVAGASLRDDYLAAIRGAGLVDVKVAAETSFAPVIASQTPELVHAARAQGLDDDAICAAFEAVTSIKVVARKPG